jgi:hypothetical protein
VPHRARTTAKGIFSGSMQTLIVQSYRTHDVAPWISDCLQSVRAWAAARGYSYEFVDDRLFDYAPAWVKQVCGTRILPITDIARMYLLRERLESGCERVVWIDADVLIFAPELFVLDDTAPYALCRELWMRATPGQEIEFGEAVNNAVFLVTQQQAVLDFWIFAVEEILRTRAANEISSLTAGTRFFTNLARAMPLRVLQNVGLLTPLLVRELATRSGVLLGRWTARFGRPIGAANLCASMVDRVASGVRVDAAGMQAAVDALMTTRGAVVNSATIPPA